ncbi:ABC transporter ATP-binding protein [Miniphocaeibacter massiliensis]|uniref:ABC transporter ATP-binding protein n=1 Tax=Miniphocaeibacter massiliensis TaxID=2041841 RepID=UPI000C1C77A6|nr:oligopeptide/dipeptide ABC transporter ATP-binding protein [Miniphocaeibacter massiliensis]
MSQKVLIEIKNLKKYFNIKKGVVLKAVDNVSFNIHKGETFGLVGESGCGKTTCGRVLTNIYSKTEGSVKYDGKEIGTMQKVDKRKFKKKAQMIFQDPYASLDPRMTIGDIIGEGIEVHFPELSSKEREDKITDLLKVIGLNSEHSARFPHELSGGQRQRVGIARALAVNPEFIVCDEPISALDVSIQAQIVNLLKKLQKTLGLTYLFISHDLSMVKHISDRIGVMYLGSIVELTTNESLYSNALHPYTKALISSIPIPDPTMEKGGRIKLEGEVPSPINPPKGCKFAGRCSECMDICKTEAPELKEIEVGHQVACHLYN